MKSELRQIVARKIRDANLEMLPYPHLIIEDFFPPDIYQDILSKNLFLRHEGEEWVSKKHIRKNRVTGKYDYRKQVNFHSDAKNYESDSDWGFWQELHETFVEGAWFPRLIMEKFPEYFQLRFGEATEHAAFWDKLENQMFLQRHEPGFNLGPHTDVPTRVFTCIFSFANQEGFENFGTHLLRHKDPYTRCWGNGHFDNDSFELVKLAPYRPNNFFLFFKTRQSFHLVPSIDDSVPNQRFGMQFQLYEPNQGIFKDLSVPDLLVPSHANSFGKFINKLRSTFGTK